MEEDLPSDVVVMQKHEVMAKEKNLFEFHTPLGMLFRIAMVISILVGIMVVYQILFQMTSKYLREYSTLKALGFSHAMLIGIVLTKAMILVVPGYTDSVRGIGIELFLVFSLGTRDKR